MITSAGVRAHYVLHEFTVYERAAGQSVDNCYWTESKLEDYGEKDAHSLGSQFTILENSSLSAMKFPISKQPKPLQVHDVLKAVGFKSDWIEMDR